MTLPHANTIQASQNPKLAFASGDWVGSVSCMYESSHQNGALEMY